MAIIYTIGLYVHILSAIAVFASLTLDWVAVAGLRRAVSAEAARLWGGVLSVSAEFGPWARIAVLVAGLFLAFYGWSWQGWIIVALVAWVLLLLLGEPLTGKDLRQLVAALKEEPDQLSSAMLARLRAPRLWFPILTRVGLAAGLVGDMTLKPSLLVGAALVLGGAVVGWAIGQVLASIEGRANQSKPTEAAAQ